MFMFEDENCKIDVYVRLCGLSKKGKKMNGKLGIIVNGPDEKHEGGYEVRINREKHHKWIRARNLLVVKNFVTFFLFFMAYFSLISELGNENKKK